MLGVILREADHSVDEGPEEVSADLAQHRNAAGRK
jgi:hypothetical protein